LRKQFLFQLLSILILLLFEKFEKIFLIRKIRKIRKITKIGEIGEIGGNIFSLIFAVLCQIILIIFCFQPYFIVKFCRIL
jgi:hypothetical protein